MSGVLEIRRLAVHHVDKKADSPEYAPHEQDISSLHPRIVEFLLDLINKIRDAENTGSTRSAHFRPDDHELGPSIVKQVIEKIDTPTDNFFDASKELALHLYSQSPATASAGLLAIVELRQPEDRSISIAILKIRYKNESIVKVVKEALTDLKVEHVENMLMESIQKGAIIPHPLRSQYHLKGVVVGVVIAALVDPDQVPTVAFLTSLLYLVYIIFILIYMLPSAQLRFGNKVKDYQHSVNELRDVLTDKEITKLEGDVFSRARRMFTIYFWITAVLYMALAFIAYLITRFFRALM